MRKKEVVLNLSTPDIKKEGRAKRHFKKRVYNRLISAGFTEEESQFGARMLLPLTSPSLQRVIKHREKLVAKLQERFNISKKEAITRASDRLLQILETHEEDDLVLFYEVYPE